MVGLIEGTSGSQWPAGRNAGDASNQVEEFRQFWKLDATSSSSKAPGGLPCHATALTFYLSMYRQVLQENDSESNALWLSSHDGAAPTYAGVARAITQTARSAVGIDVSPYMFRASAASSAALHAGDNSYLGSALLHHRDKRIAEKHYNFASNLHAAQSLRDLIRNQL